MKNPMSRWMGKTPEEVVAILEARLAASHAENNALQRKLDESVSNDELHEALLVFYRFSGELSDLSRTLRILGGEKSFWNKWLGTYDESYHDKADLVTEIRGFLNEKIEEFRKKVSFRV